MILSNLFAARRAVIPSILPAPYMLLGLKYVPQSTRVAFPDPIFEV